VQLVINTPGPHACDGRRSVDAIAMMAIVNDAICSGSAVATIQAINKQLSYRVYSNALSNNIGEAKE
jgi:hypothetical protein